MIVVIGAGPAGLAAVRQISQSGNAVLLIDAAPRIGGQYWRHRSEVTGYRSKRSLPLFKAVLENPLVTYINNAHIWSVEKVGDAFLVNYVKAGEEHHLHASKLILATGAYDRSLPYPGWTSPGAMTPGAAQALLKGQGVRPGNSIVVSGTGPFLFPVATALAEAGAKVQIVEAHSPLRWLLSFPALLLNPGKFAELFYYAQKILFKRIPISFGCAVTRYENGVAEISRVSSNLTKVAHKNSISVDVVAAGWGFQPDVTLGGILGCQEIFDRDSTVIFAVDRNQRSSASNVWIAGEATGIGGADLALIEGEIAGRSAIGKPVGVIRAFTRFRKKVFAKALQRSYPVGTGWQSWLAAETLICRCEEVSHGEICNSVVELGAESARTSKLFTRAGMGLCQGRVCARNVNDLVATQIGTEISDIEKISAHNRPIAAPLTLGLLADGKNQKNG
jgi:NADPH-dependent 2,4-dienoyl-CoA reductase/sulfur reductase-like enzyme